MYRVTKRDGKVAEFDISKISTAIKQAFEACERQFNDNIIDFLVFLCMKVSKKCTIDKKRCVI